MNNELERINALINTAFEDISPVDYDKVVTRLQERVKELENPEYKINALGRMKTK